MELTDIRIEPFTDDDIDGILVIERKSFSMPWSRESFEDVMKYPFLNGYCAKCGDDIAGYVIFHCLFEDSEVLDIAVGEEYRRLGIGRKLLSICQDRVRALGAERIMLEVRQSNLSAQKLYLSCGFSKTGERRNYYKNPTENAILMEKTLL